MVAPEEPTNGMVLKWLLPYADSSVAALLRPFTIQHMEQGSEFQDIVQRSCASDVSQRDAGLLKKTSRDLSYQVVLSGPASHIRNLSIMNESAPAYLDLSR